MTLTRLSLSNPVAVVVAGLLATLFGVISLTRLPVQLTPQVDQPFINISTGWRAAAPAEVESEIIEPQEDVLRGLPGMTRIEATASRGSGSIRIEFDIDVDINRALIEVMNRLNQVPRYPPDANEPVIRVSGDQFSGAIAWFAIKPLPGNDREAATYQDFVREVVQDRLERVPGVASTNAFGGRPYEVRVTFDPYRAASLGLDLSRAMGRIGNNEDVSGGFSEVGKRQYTLRFAGRYEVADLGDMIIDWRNAEPVKLSDVATVTREMTDRSGMLAQNGGPSIALNAIPEVGVNILEVMGNLQEAVDELDRDVLSNAGLSITQVYDETLYVERAISMVTNNLLLGIMLAIGVLWWFLRKFRATLVVALAIPLCVLLDFIVLDAAGRTLNAISLAGLAFAVGMVLDAAIVVLENIVRLRERGEDSNHAAEKGTMQVWGALLASTATTVAIFLPVVFLKDVAGQLFADLALTIAVAVVASLIVAVTVLPTAAANILKDAKLRDRHSHWWENTSNFIMRLTDRPGRRMAWILGLITIPVLLVVLLKPDADYLPEGRMNFVFAPILPPPGLGPDTAEEELVKPIMERLQPFLDGTREPAVENYFIGMFGNFGFMGARAKDPDKLDDLVGVLWGEVLGGFPDTMAFPQRSAIFQRYSGGRGIDIDLQARDYEALLAAGAAGFGAVMQHMPGAQARPQPGLELAEPELRFLPDDRRLAEAGWTRNDLATVIRALGDGAFVGEYFDGDRRLNIIVRSEGWVSPEELMALPVATPDGAVQPVGNLVELKRTGGPSQIRRIDRRRTLTISVTPPEEMSLERALEILRADVAPAIQAAMPEDGVITYRGSAEDLDIALRNMSGSFALAIVILYLLISALFRSFKDSLLVVLTIPMATIGGVLAIRILNLVGVIQPMDLLTMIGFVILLGLVVNNAILLVHQSRAGEREGLWRRDAVHQAVRLRLRPILMSTMTTVFGMLPLLVLPGAGSELYRGLAAVIVGGMLVSTAFTLILLPSLLRLGEEKQRKIADGALEPA